MLHLLIILNIIIAVFAETPEEAEGVRYANRCEACKILATELQERLQETGKSHDVIEIGYSLDDVKPKKRKEYKLSELRLLESMENVCDRILEYNLHKEREDSTRFAKGMPQTFQTLHGLVNKGVKVELGIPYELWDKPSVEVTQMKSQCEDMLEQFEDVISDWYFKLQDNKTLIKHLCEDEVLRDDERKCLTEVFVPKKKKKVDAEKEKKQSSDGTKEAKQNGDKKRKLKETSPINAKGDKQEL